MKRPFLYILIILLTCLNVRPAYADDCTVGCADFQVKAENIPQCCQTGNMAMEMDMHGVPHPVPDPSESCSHGEFCQYPDEKHLFAQTSAARLIPDDLPSVMLNDNNLITEVLFSTLELSVNLPPPTLNTTPIYIHNCILLI